MVESLSLLGCRSPGQVISVALALPENFLCVWALLNFYSKSSPQRRDTMVHAAVEICGALSSLGCRGATQHVFRYTSKELGHTDGRTNCEEEHRMGWGGGGVHLEAKDTREIRGSQRPTVPTTTLSRYHSLMRHLPALHGQSCSGLEHLTQRS